MKKISVIIPNYNYEKYIIERIDSILNQTYPIYELIILDDCSTDKSVDLIENKIKTIDNVKVKFIKNKKNSNCVFSQWQKGLENITGDYFWIAEADDSSDKDFLKVAMEKFDQDDKLILFYSESYKFDENGKIFSNNLKDYMDIFNTGKWNNDYINDGKKEITECLSYNNTILNVSSVVWKKQDFYYDIFEKAKKFKVAGDWYIYSKVLEYGNIAFSSKALNYFRKHNNSVSTIINPNIEYKEVLSIQEGIRQKYKLDKETLYRQKMRRRFMGYCENDENINKNGSIAILFDKYDLNKNYKKYNNLINKYIESGYKCDIYFKNSYNKSSQLIFNELKNKYEMYADIYTDWILNKEYNFFISTSRESFDFIKKMKNCKKIYIVKNIFEATKLKKELNIKMNKIKNIIDTKNDIVMYLNLI